MEPYQYRAPCREPSGYSLFLKRKCELRHPAYGPCLPPKRPKKVSYKLLVVTVEANSLQNARGTRMDPYVEAILILWYKLSKESMLYSWTFLAFSPEALASAV